MGRLEWSNVQGLWAMLNFRGVFKSIHVYSCSYDLDSSKLWKLQSRMIRKLLIFINSMTWLVGNEETCQGTMNQIESMNPTRLTENPNAQTHMALKLQIENSPKNAGSQAQCWLSPLRGHMFSTACQLPLVFTHWRGWLMTASWTFGHSWNPAVEIDSWAEFSVSNTRAGCPGGKFVWDPRTPFSSGDVRRHSP